MLSKSLSDPGTKLQCGNEGLVWCSLANLMYLHFARLGTPRRLVLGLAFAVVEKLCYSGVLCRVHFKKGPTSLPFISLHWGDRDGIEDSLSPVSLFSFSLPVLRPPPCLCDHSITLALQGLDTLLKC